MPVAFNRCSSLSPVCGRARAYQRGGEYPIRDFPPSLFPLHLPSHKKWKGVDGQTVGTLADLFFSPPSLLPATSRRACIDFAFFRSLVREPRQARCVRGAPNIFRLPLLFSPLSPSRPADAGELTKTLEKIASISGRSCLPPPFPADRQGEF